MSVMLFLMQLRTDRMSCKSRHGALYALILHSATTFLLLIGFDGGQSEPIMAVVGDNITLPCYVKPETDTLKETLEWSRLDLKPRFVHVRRFGEDRLADQNPSYKGRTSVSVDRLKQGDVSLKLSKVKLSDQGTYKCFIPGLSTESSVQLIVDQSEPMMAVVGDNITLPCHVKPDTDTVNETLEWSRLDLKPRFVHVRRFGEDRLSDQNPSYKGRTAVSVDRLKQGDVSLKLSKVKLSDQGTYKCFIPGLSTESSVQLIVGAVIEVDTVSSGVLHCESKGWYPEPEVLWLDGEGNVLSAGRTETVKGPYDLYTVSSSVTVEKRHKNRFICKIQQNNINQSRETAIDVPDEFFTESSHSYTSTIIAIVFAILFVLVAAFVVWKWRQNRTSEPNSYEDKEMMTGLQKKNDTSSKDSEQDPLIKRETDKGEMEKLEKEAEQEKNNKSLTKDLGDVLQTEDEIKQEQHMGQSKANISPAQRNRKCEEKSLNVGTGSKIVIDDERQQETYVSPGGDMKTVMVQKPSPSKGEGGQKESDDKDKTTSVNNEGAGEDAADDKTQKTDVSPGGDMKTGTVEKLSPAKTEGGQEEGDDKDKTTSVNNEAAGEDAADDRTQKTDVSPGGDMKTGTVEKSSPAKTERDQKEGDDKDKKTSVNDEAAGEDAADDKTQKTDVSPGGDMKTGTVEKSSPVKTEGDQEEEIKQEQHMGQSKSNISPAQRNRKCEEKSLNVGTGSKIVIDDERQQETYVSPGGDMKTVMVQKPSPAKGEGGQKESDDKDKTTSVNDEAAGEDAADDKTQKTDVSLGGDMKTGTVEKLSPAKTEGGQAEGDDKDKTTSVNNEAAGEDAADDKTQKTDVSPGGDMKTGTVEKSSPAKTEGDQKEGDDKEKTTSVNDEAAGEDAADDKTQKTDVSLGGDMKTGTVEKLSPAKTEGGQAEGDDKDKTTSVNNEAAGEDAADDKTQKTDVSPGGDMKTGTLENPSPVKTEGDQEEEIKQEQHMGQSKTNISPAQRNRKCEEKSLNVGTGSKIVIDDERQQETYVSPGGDMKTVMVQKPSPAKGEGGQKESDDKEKTTSVNDEAAGEDAADDKTQKTDVSLGGDMKTGTVEKLSPAKTEGGQAEGDDKDKTTSVNNEAAGEDAADDKTQKTDVSPGGDMKTGTVEKSSPAKTEGDQKEGDDKEKTTSVNDEAAGEDAADDKTQKTDVSLGGDMKTGTVEKLSPAKTEGGQAEGDDKDKTTSVNNEAAGEDAADDKTQKTDVSPGGDMKTGTVEKSSPAKTEGDQKEGDDKEKTTSVNDEAAGEDAADDKTQKTDVSLGGDMKTGTVEKLSPAKTEGGQAEGDDKDKTTSVNNEAAGEDAADDKTQKTDVSPGGDMKTGTLENPSPVKTEGDQEEEIKQEQHMGQSKSNISPAQRNRKCEEKSLNLGTGSKIVIDDERQQETYVSPGGDMKTVMVQKPSPAKGEGGQKESDDKDKTTSVNNEGAGEDAADDKKQKTDVSP
ncbi:enolase-phosphatase E1-like isoform X3 [Channa argus]|uniref:enolase-phosphatase E1-like isoform X3 n=2 Tax=Channa argus TaxID=215402 RepID=UPI003522FBE9